MPPHAQLDDARVQVKPAFSWLAAYQFRGGLDPMVMGGFSVRLPVWKDRNQERAIAGAEIERTAAAHDRAKSEILARVRRSLGSRRTSPRSTSACASTARQSSAGGRCVRVGAMRPSPPAARRCSWCWTTSTAGSAIAKEELVSVGATDRGDRIARGGDRKRRCFEIPGSGGRNEEVMIVVALAVAVFGGVALGYRFGRAGRGPVAAAVVASSERRALPLSDASADRLRQAGAVPDLPDDSGEKRRRASREAHDLPLDDEPQRDLRSSGNDSMGMAMVPEEVEEPSSAAGRPGRRAGATRAVDAQASAPGRSHRCVRRSTPFVKTVRAVGQIAIDERRMQHVHTKIQGWIEHLHAPEPSARRFDGVIRC